MQRQVHFMFSHRFETWSIECYDVLHRGNVNELTLLARLTLTRQGRERREVNGINIREDLLLDMKERLGEYIWRDAVKTQLWFTHFLPDSSLPLYDFIRASLSVDLPDNLLKKMNRAKNIAQLVPIVAGRVSCRSVHRALYESIQAQLKTQGYYNPVADIALCRSFDDPNLVVRLLKTPVKNAMIEHLHTLEHAIYFFKKLQRFHHPAHIVTSIEKSLPYTGRFYSPKWVDIVRMADELLQVDPKIVGKKMRKTRMQAKSLHEELIRCRQYLHIEKHHLKTFHYSRDERGLEGRYDGLEFRLPKTNLELLEWSDALHNCLYAYENVISEKRSLILGIYQGKTLTYAIEICDGEICQAYGKYNEPIDEKNLDKIYKWFVKI